MLKSVCAGTFHNTTLYITNSLTGSSFHFFLSVYHKPYTNSVLKTDSWVCKVKHLKVSNLHFYRCPCNSNSICFPSCTVDNRIQWGRSDGKNPIIIPTGLCINANAERSKFLSWCSFPPEMIQPYDGPSVSGFC